MEIFFIKRQVDSIPIISSPLQEGDTKRGYRRALLLEYFTVGYSILEAVLSILAGVIAGSVALIGFGLDSIAESLSGVVLIWRLKKQSTIASVQEENAIESKTQKLVGATFLILGGYVLYETIKMVVTISIPAPSLLGIIIATAALVIMPLLSYKKYRLGQQLGLKSLVADAKETLVCSLLSLALLVGLIANYFWGLWYVDPVVSLLIVAFLFREGRELLSGEEDEED